VSPFLGCEANQKDRHVQSISGAAPGRTDDRQRCTHPLPASIELTAKARFLFGKQIMPLDQADSPARRIYFALQSAYIGSDDERVQGLDAARELVAAFKEATTSALACEILDRALIAAETDDCYHALKLARRVIQHEDAVLGRIAEPASETTEHSTPPAEGPTTTMPNINQAARAYESAATHRSQREQEADVFHRAIGALKSARDSGPTTRVQALADNHRLWMTVADLMRDPLNSLPPELRAEIVSIGLTVQREMETENPDFDFLIAINENIAAGLTAQM
jgi:flagellar biosynthesis repressor protein FlbT